MQDTGCKMRDVKCRVKVSFLRSVRTFNASDEPVDFAAESLDFDFDLFRFLGQCGVAINNID